MILDEDTQSSSRDAVGNDNRPSSTRNLSLDFLMGLRFFSRLPTGATQHETPDLNRMAPALGMVSVAIGAGPALLVPLLAWFGMPILLAVVIGMAALALVTGAMAEDAIADSFDGLWGGHDAARRLEIMHDSRHGTYGVLAIVLFVLARLSALVALYVALPFVGALVWLAAQVLSRQATLWLPLRLEPARKDGAGHAAGALDGRMFAIGMGIAALLALIGAGLFIGLSGLLVGSIVAAIVVAAWTYLCAKKVGGFTGDLIGALQALVEIALLSTFMIFV